MPHLYHRKPQDLQGDILYPLNTLKNIFPDLYEKKVEKYGGREFVMNQKIPGLDCLWNDVLHFSPVSPQDIVDALREAGDPLDFDPTFYEVDPSMLEPEKTIVYLYNNAESDDKMNPSNFTSYNPADITTYNKLPLITKNYYRQMIIENKKPLFYHGVPHILYKGTINVSQLKVMNVIL